MSGYACDERGDLPVRFCIGAQLLVLRRKSYRPIPQVEVYIATISHHTPLCLFGIDGADTLLKRVSKSGGFCWADGGFVQDSSELPPCREWKTPPLSFEPTCTVESHVVHSACGNAISPLDLGTPRAGL